MNDWDVSHITDFSELFMSMATFNEPIGGWDVSNGYHFVSNEQSVGLKRSIVLLSFQLGCTVNRSIMCGV
jgi:hypothetical protein